MTLLARAREASESLPRILFVGDGWENYLEYLTDYEIDLMFSPGRHRWLRPTVFADGLSLDELQQYPVVAAYGFSWHDRGDAEANLRSYVEEGGTLILDATGNLDGLSYTLSDTIFLETLIRRADVDADGQLVADPDLAAERPELQSIDSAPFRDEGGGSWHGAAYESVTGESAHSALVRLDGRPVVSIQRLGSGRIYWIGSNLIWHAFLYGEPEEALLVQAVIEHALEHSGDPDAGASSD